MVDREARDKLCALIEQWLDGEIGALEFGDRMEDVGCGDDGITWQVYTDLWLTYDDFDDHLYRPERSTWDYMQRALLLLKSDAELVHTGGRRWAWRQGVAACGLGVAGLIALGGLFSWPTVLAALATCTAALLLVALVPRRDGDTAGEGADTDAVAPELLWPFTSVSEMLRVHRSVPGFRKRRFDPDASLMGTPSGRRRFSIPAPLSWILLPVLLPPIAPLLLVGAALPERTSGYRIVLP